MEVARDPVAVCQYVHFAHPPLRGRQLPRERRLVDEGGHHVELFVAERLCSVVPQGHQFAGEGTSAGPGFIVKVTIDGPVVTGSEGEPIFINSVPLASSALRFSRVGSLRLMTS